MQRFLPFLLLSACFLFEPTETGSTAMVGRVLGPRGTPLKDVQVTSLEARDDTDAGGEFAVAWKSPNLHVGFMWEGARYHRQYQPEDEGKRVDIRLPEVRNAALECALAEPCDLALTWDLGGGLRAEADTRCGKPAAPVLGIPKGAPTAVCKVPGGEGRAVAIDDHGDSMIVRAPARLVRVRVEGADCRIALRGKSPKPGNVLEAELAGSATATARCAAGVAIPAVLGASDTEITLQVQAGAAWLVPLEGTTALRLVGEQGALAGVAAVLEIEGGKALLPVGLPTGTYRLVAGDLGLLQAPPPASAGAAVWAKTGDGWVASLALEAPLAAGELPMVASTER
ncbi:MAG: hypothetical protein EP330_15240 [Deltaproteobacteria bacterium]|nr:MAG: hypothetical protein EP330_15240 [Deltaproteobacteria bacterium]